MNEEIFKRKNDIGVEIEYTIIDEFEKEGKNIRIYTDFTPSSDENIINLYVDRQDENNQYIPLSEEERKIVLEEYKTELSTRMGEIIKEKGFSPKMEEKQTSKNPKEDLLQERKEELATAMKRNVPKEITKARGRYIKELKSAIKKEEDASRKEELQNELGQALDAHKEQIADRYTKEYCKQKKTFKALITALPKGIALSIKKVAATINELKLAKTGKEKFYKGIETLKEALIAVGTPVDFTVRFAINHWYLLLLLVLPSLTKNNGKDNGQDQKDPQAEPSLEPAAVTEEDPAREVTPKKVTGPVEVFTTEEQKQEVIDIRKTINQQQPEAPIDPVLNPKPVVVKPSASSQVNVAGPQTIIDVGGMGDPRNLVKPSTTTPVKVEPNKPVEINVNNNVVDQPLVPKEAPQPGNVYTAEEQLDTIYNNMLAQQNEYNNATGQANELFKTFEDAVEYYRENFDTIEEAQNYVKEHEGIIRWICGPNGMFETEEEMINHCTNGNGLQDINIGNQTIEEYLKTQQDKYSGFEYNPNLSYEENQKIFTGLFGAAAAALFAIFCPQAAVDPTMSGIGLFIPSIQPISSDGPQNGL